MIPSVFLAEVSEHFLYWISWFVCDNKSLSMLNWIILFFSWQFTQIAINLSGACCFLYVSWKWITVILLRWIEFYSFEHRFEGSGTLGFFCLLCYRIWFSPKWYTVGIVPNKSCYYCGIWDPSPWTLSQANIQGSIA